MRGRRTLIARSVRVALWVALLLIGPWPVGAAGSGDVRFFEISSREEFARGTLDGMGIGPLGSLSLADRVERTAEIEAPFLFAIARAPRGWVVGTGNDGKIESIDATGKVTDLYDAPEPEIFAVWVDPDGTVFAGSSPEGKVYRIRDGHAEVYFDPGQTYIWGLARSTDGSLLVATGTEGKLYRVTAKGRGSVLFDSDEPHIRSLLPMPGGRVLVGTAGAGLIIDIGPDGKGRTIYDADQPEIVALTAAPDGTIYAAAIASEASLLPAPQRPAPKGKDEQEEDDAKQQAEQNQDEAKGQVTVIVQAESAARPAPRAGAVKGPRSAILRVSPQGVVTQIQDLDDATVYALLWSRDRLWIGTGQEGKLYTWRDDQLVLAKDVDERQVIGLAADDPGPVFVTTNSAALYRVVASSERHGSYTSPTLDADQISAFGRLHWLGDLPHGAHLRFAFRSGMSAEPDATWSDWTQPAEGNDVSLAGTPRGRYLQWRAEFDAADGRSPVLRQVQISYQQENLAPEIERLAVSEPGVVVVPAGFNAGDQVYEAWHPDRDRMFTSLRSTGDNDSQRFKTLRRAGYRSLRWKADDPNDDDLTYELDFRPEASTHWLTMAENLEDPVYSFDTTALPDGWYRFRLRAFDRKAGSEDAAERQEASRVTPPVLIDNTPPELGKVSREGGQLVVQVEDRWSPIRAARFSVDAGKWRGAEAVDGLVDGRHEALRVPLPKSGQLLLLQVEDAAHNVATFDLSRAGS